MNIEHMELYFIPVCILAIILATILLAREIVSLVKDARPENGKADPRIVWLIAEILLIIISILGLIFAIR